MLSLSPHEFEWLLDFPGTHDVEFLFSERVSYTSWLHFTVINEILFRATSTFLLNPCHVHFHAFFAQATYNNFLTIGNAYQVTYTWSLECCFSHLDPLHFAAVMRFRYSIQLSVYLFHCLPTSVDDWFLSVYWFALMLFSIVFVTCRLRCLITLIDRLNSLSSTTIIFSVGY